MNNTYVKQKLDELHLIDDFLFFQMMNHPKYGPKFSRLLLKLILGRDVGKLHVIPQKEYYGENTDLHGARPDVYLEEEEPDFLLDFEDEGVPSVYDLEPEKKKDLESKDNLPKRVRFYHAVIDSHTIFYIGQDQSNHSDAQQKSCRFKKSEIKGVHGRYITNGNEHHIIGYRHGNHYQLQ